MSGRRIAFPADAPAVGGPLPVVARRLLDEHRDVLGLDRVPGELRVVREETSISGHHLRLAQFVGGVRVEGSEVAAHVAMDGRPVLLAADVFPVGGVATTPKVPAADAVAVARTALIDEDADAEDSVDARGAADGAAFENQAPELWIRPEGKSGRLVWRIDVRTADESARVTIDAADGELIGLRDLQVGADGQARVFDPNPVFSSRDTRLRDKKDAYQPALDAALVPVTLHRLSGTGRVTGTWCDAARGPGDGVNNALDWSDASRDDTLFELVNAYFHVDRAQERIRTLGITDANGVAQKVYAHALALDQSYFDLFDRTIRFGDGGVDDAEDGDIVVHEYGHAIQEDIVAGFGSTAEGSAVGEGWSDFLACALHATGDDRWDPLVGSWDATSYSNANPPFLRRVDRSKTYPQDVTDEPHADGEIWSRFQWDVRSVVGGDDAIRLSIEALRYMTSESQFRQAANAFLTANIALREGRDDDTIRGLLRERGLPFTRPPAGTSLEDVYEENDDSSHATPIATGTSTDLILADDDWFRVAAAPFSKFRARAEFDPVDLDLDLELRSPNGTILASSHGVAGQETVSGVAGSDGATFLVRATRGASTIGIAAYRLDLLALPLDSLRSGKTALRRTVPGTPDAVTVAVGAPKAASGSRLVVRSSAKGSHGSVNDLRVVSPSGTVVVDFGAGANRGGARVVVPVDEPGAWRVEVRPRDGTSGGYTIQATLRR